jgi:Domain of unknown function (DUF4359)
MKIKASTYLVGMVLVGIGVAMAVTNPNEKSYQNYAAQQLTRYLQEEECVKLDVSYQDLCKLLDRNEGQTLLKRVVADNTERQNYWLFSIYKTNFSTAKLLPSFLSNFVTVPQITYETETVGLFSQFQTYKAEQQ